MFGRVCQVALLTLAGLPLFALMAGFSGVEPITVVVVMLTLLAPMFAAPGGGLGIRKTQISPRLGLGRITASAHTRSPAASVGAIEPEATV